MADYDLLYQDTYIDALLATANELKTAGYIYKGVATPSTNPGTPTERVAYLASEPGTYTNFGGIVIASGLYSLTYASGTWTGTQMSAGSDIEVVQTTGQSTSVVMSQKATTDAISIDKPYAHYSIEAGGNSAPNWLWTSDIPVSEGVYGVSFHGSMSKSSGLPNDYSYLTIRAFDSSNNAVANFYDVYTTSNPDSSAQVVDNNVGTLTSKTLGIVVPSNAVVLRIGYRLSAASLFDFTMWKKEELAPNIDDVALSIPIETSLDAIKVSTTLTGGYISSSGVKTPGGTTYHYTNLIQVNEGEIVETTAFGSNAVSVLSAYAMDGSYLSVNSIIGNNSKVFITYNVPARVRWVRVCYRDSDVPAYDRYVQIRHNINAGDTLKSDTDNVKNVNKAGLSLITPTSISVGNVFHNGALTSVSDGFAALYDVTGRDKVYFTTQWNSATGGYEMVAFLDSSNNVISTRYNNQANIGLSPYDEEIIVPSNATSMYVNSRYESPNVKVNDSRINRLIDKKYISILFIGNSLTQDAISYLPWLLTEFAPQINFRFYVWYNGGYTLAQQYQKFVNDQTCEIFSSTNVNGCAWRNQNNAVKMSSILSTYRFDIVCLQEYFNYKSSYTDADLTDFNNCVNYIRANYNYPFKVATLFHAPKRDAAENIFNLTKSGNALILKKTIADSINPAGIAIYRALSTSLDSLGTQGHLSPDGTHAQEGLPCLLEAYVSALWICDLVGLPRSIINDKLRITSTIYGSINVPGPNGSLITGTDAQHDLAQDVAVKAWKEGKFLLNANLTEYTN
jgi:hypothetical protein